MDLYSIDASVILRKIMNYETLIHAHRMQLGDY
jgi:hypothetical protein